MCSDTLVTVLMPLYNAERFVAEALRSVQAQTHANYEVIIVDDGSTDGTSQRVRPFLSDSRFKYLRQENRGAAAARNKGIAIASGEWIAFLDGDDIWLPRKLERQMDVVRSTPDVSIVFTNGTEFGDNGHARPFYSDPAEFESHDLLEHSLVCCRFYTSSVMVRRQALIEAGLFNSQLDAVSDYDMWLRLLLSGKKACGVWEDQTRYRVHPSSISEDRVKVQSSLLAVYDGLLPLVRNPRHRAIIQRSMSRTASRLHLAAARQSVLGGNCSKWRLRMDLWNAWRAYPGSVRPLRYLAMDLLGMRRRVARRLARRW